MVDVRTGQPFPKAAPTQIGTRAGASAWIDAGLGARGIDPHRSQLAPAWDVPPNIYPGPGG
jgi:hypothetical protein